MWVGSECVLCMDGYPMHERTPAASAEAPAAGPWW